MRDHYINNPDFLKALIEHKRLRDLAEETGTKEPRIPNYIGECFIKIADRLARKPNFASYTFKDEMISDAIENCMMYYRNFNPEKSKNPFAYFTQIIYYAFLRRIIKEKKELYVKYKATEQFGIFEHDLLSEEGDEHKLAQFSTYENISEYIEKFEQGLKKKKEKKPKGVEKFLQVEETVEQDSENVVDEILNELIEDDKDILE